MTTGRPRPGAPVAPLVMGAPPHGDSGEPTTDEASLAAVDVAFDARVGCVDTAPVFEQGPRA